MPSHAVGSPQAEIRRPSSACSAAIAPSTGGSWALRPVCELSTRCSTANAWTISISSCSGSASPAGQFFGNGGHVLGGRLIDLEVHEVCGLGHEVWLVVVKPGTPRLLLVVVAKDDQGSSAVVGGSGRPLGNSGLCGGRFGADRSGRFGFLLRHDRSPEKFEPRSSHSKCDILPLDEGGNGPTCGI